MDNMNQGGCKCPHHKVVPVALILIGLGFLLQSLNILTASFVGLVWPILVIIIGFVKLGGCKCCKQNHG